MTAYPAATAVVAAVLMVADEAVMTEGDDVKMDVSTKVIDPTKH